MEKFQIQKLLCGHYIESVPKNCSKKLVYVLDGDGLWEIRKSKVATFTTLLHEFSVAGLEGGIRENGFELNIPKIPISYFQQIISFFKKIYEENSSEVFVQCFYDLETREFVLFCPEQNVGPASVNYKRDLDFEKNKILAFEIHSHASMNAFFSATDNRDEKADGFFGVVGKLNNFYPEVIFTYVVGGERKELDMEDIFDINYDEDFPKEWFDRVKKKETMKVDFRNKDYLINEDVFDDDFESEDIFDDEEKMMKSFYQMEFFKNGK